MSCHSEVKFFKSCVFLQCISNSLGSYLLNRVRENEENNRIL